MKRLCLTLFWPVMAVAAVLSPAQAQSISHLNQDIGDHVMLVADIDPDSSNVCHTLSFRDRGFFQVFPDGTRSAEVFKVPKGYLLVVTDVEWSAYGGPNGTNPLLPGRTLRLSIALRSSATNVSRFVFQSRGVTLDPDTADGRPGTSEQLTTGFVVAPRTYICPSVLQLEPNFGATVFIERLILRGYLIKSRE